MSVIWYFSMPISLKFVPNLNVPFVTNLKIIAVSNNIRNNTLKIAQEVRKIL